MLDNPFGEEGSKAVTSLRIMFGSSRVEIEEEKEAVPFTCLVADCGGILGLFIGFNFTMIWDLFVYLSGRTGLGLS